MKHLLGIILLSFFLSNTVAAQSDSSIGVSNKTIDTSIINIVGDSNSTISKDSMKKRVRLVTAANIIGYGGTMASLYAAWYSKYPQGSFHFFNDNKEWKQVDKVGHGYSAYIASYGSTEMWKWTGMSKRKSAVLGSLSAFTYMTVIETLDGFSSEWGWSWGDMGANTFGSGLFLGQELAWGEQRVQFKFSFHKKNYSSVDLNERTDNLFGNSLQERMLKDYNGQTYWLSANLKAFLPKSNLPEWLNVAFGYGAENMFGAERNIGKDDYGNINFNRPDVTRYRQYFIAPDIDLTKIKTKSKFLKLALGALNSFKFPLPSIEYNSKGMFVFHPLHF